MPRMDRTVKTLLALIALFAGILALRPYVSLDSPAEAQTAGPSRAGVAPLNANLITRINYRDTVQGVVPMDNTGAFIVYTKDMVEVYRVDRVNIP